MTIYWLETSDSDFTLISELCQRWNSGRLFEIFWEYAELTSKILNERKGRAWLCYEDNKLSGFALGRTVNNFFVIEELWAEFDGFFGESGTLSTKDSIRVEAFKNEVLDSLSQNDPVIIRAAFDDHFAHGIARSLKLPWFNGLVLAERTLTGKVDLMIPHGYSLRDYKIGDESFFSSLYLEVYSEQVSLDTFRKWATKDSCKTIVACCGESPVGFIISERRPYHNIGDFAIAVSPKHHRKGVGGMLLDAGLNALFDMGARRVIADYRTSNGATHALYGSRQFRPVRVYNYFRLTKSEKEISEADLNLVGGRGFTHT